MESVLKLAQRLEVTQAQPQDGLEVLDEIKEVKRLIARNEMWFQQECDENLIESCVYQRIALLARYRYLLDRAKRQGLKGEYGCPAG